MNMKAVAVAGVLLASSFSAANAALPSYEAVSTAGAGAFSAALNTWKNTWQSVYTENFGTNFIYNQSGSLGSGTVVGLFASNLKTTGQFYTQNFFYSDGSSTYNMPTNSPSVPGPDAGAGLAALSVVGAVLWMRNRKSALNA